LLSKLDTNGNIQWQKGYEGVGTQLFQQTLDGGCIVAGQYDYKALVLKLNSVGSIEWQKTYGGSFISSNINSIQQTSEGGYIVAGLLRDSGNIDYNVILKLNSDGSIAWQKTYGTNQYFNSIQQTSDGGYIAGGTRWDTGINENHEFWLVKLDATGNIQWQYKYGGASDDYFNCMQQTADSGYIVAGETQNYPPDIWVLKLDGNGNILWQKTYGGNSTDYANSIRRTSDGGYIMAGVTFSFGAGNEDFWTLKLDANGSIGGSCGIIGSSNGIRKNTSITPTNSNTTVADTDVSVTATTVTSQDSNATTTTQCSSQ
jgi:hypothetical protein